MKIPKDNLPASAFKIVKLSWRSSRDPPSSTIINSIFLLSYLYLSLLKPRIGSLVISQQEIRLSKRVKMASNLEAMNDRRNTANSWAMKTHLAREAQSHIRRQYRGNQWKETLRRTRFALLGFVQFCCVLHVWSCKAVWHAQKTTSRPRSRALLKLSPDSLGGTESAVMSQRCKTIVGRYFI